MSRRPPSRFVVLFHEVPSAVASKTGRESHYDLMIESDGVLATWAVAAWPPAPGRAISAVRLADHRLAYLEYQGPVSHGRGMVTRITAGTCTILGLDPITSDAGAAWTVSFDSPQWHGRVRIAENQITAEN